MARKIRAILGSDQVKMQANLIGGAMHFNSPFHLNTNHSFPDYSAFFAKIEGASITGIASNFIPPKPPMKPDNWCDCSLILFLCFSIILSLPTLGVPLLVVIGIGFSRHSKWTIDDKVFQEKMPAYSQAMENWNNTSYCSRCDLVFIEGEEDSESPSELVSFLRFPM